MMAMSDWSPWDAYDAEAAYLFIIGPGSRFGCLAGP